MTTEFDEGELNDLRELVAGALKELLIELARVDQRDYRAMLQAKYERMLRLATHLGRTEPFPVGAPS